MKRVLFLIFVILMSVEVCAKDLYLKAEILGVQGFFSRPTKYRSGTLLLGMSDRFGTSFGGSVGAKLSFGRLEFSYGNYQLYESIHPRGEVDRLNKFGLTYFFKSHSPFHFGLGLNYFYSTQKVFMSKGGWAPLFAVEASNELLYASWRMSWYLFNGDRMMMELIAGVKLNF